ncbi:MAG: type II secretion system protein [Patescibacteria group bacterium]
MKNHKGFTLIELLVVIAIIAILSTLAVVALGNARQKSRDAKRVSDVKQISTALELYFGDVSGYPVQTTTLGTAATTVVLCNGATATGFQATAVACHATANTVYMGQVPAAPTPPTVATQPLNIYAYGAAAAGTYCLEFWLEGITGGLAAGSNRMTPEGVTAGVCP